MYRLHWFAVLLVALAPGFAEAQPAAGHILSAAETLFEERFSEEHLTARLLRWETGDESGPYTLSLADEGGIPRGRVYAKIYARRRAVGWAMLYVAHHDSVLFTRHRVVEGDELTASNTKAAWMETTQLIEPPASVETWRSGGESLYARRILPAGHVVRQRDVRPALAAEAGRPVLMSYERNRIQMMLSCTARESGTIGEIIRVYGDATDAVYYAKLTGPGQAVWIDTL